MISIATCTPERERRSWPHSRWFLVPLFLCLTTEALADEAPEGTRHTATVFSAGGGMLTGGGLVSHTVLAEGFAEQELYKNPYIMHVGFIPKKKLKQGPSVGVAQAESPGAITCLVGNWPNPFQASTTVRLDLGRAAPVKLRIYDVRGRLVRTLAEEPLAGGQHRITWDGRNDAGQRVAMGVYLLEMKAGDYRGQRKMVFAP